MMRFGFVLVLIVAALVALWRFVLFPPEAAPEATLACRHSVYDLSDGRIVWFSATRAPDALRYYLMTGETGVLRPEPSSEKSALRRFTAGPGWDLAAPVVARLEFRGCDDPKIAFEHRGAKLTGARRPVDVVETHFESEGVTLAGRLVLPQGPGPFPVAVLVHGSERDSAIWNNRFQFMFPAQGIGVFVYDKRGTGQSEGSYTQDFHLLAKDAAAAMARAKTLAGARGSRFGYEGGSQAGWIIPLAVRLSGADFSVIGYGLAESPLAEDREQVLSELRAMGYGDDALAKARAITDVTGRVMSSGFREGYDELAAIKARFGQEPWFEKIQGEFTGEFLRNPPWLLQIFGPFFGVGTSWTHDPVPVLKANAQPSLWILAGKDTEAPSENTLRILRELQPTLPELDIAVFPTADHGILETKFEDGEHKPVRFSEGYFEMLAAWIKTQRLDAPPPGVQTFEGAAR